MRRLSLNARAAQDAHSTDEVEVVLITFEHAALEAPLRFSTDPTERISTEPLVYGTRSRWQGADPATEPYLFVLASVGVPSDMEEAASSAQIVLDAVDVSIAEVLRSFTDRATAHVAVVLASSPDVVEAEWHNLKLMSAAGGDDNHPLELSRLPIEEESAPTDWFSKQRFPGLYR